MRALIRIAEALGVTEELVLAAHDLGAPAVPPSRGQRAVGDLDLVRQTGRVEVGFCRDLVVDPEAYVGGARLHPGRQLDPGVLAVVSQQPPPFEGLPHPQGVAVVGQPRALDLSPAVGVELGPGRMLPLRRERPISEMIVDAPSPPGLFDQVAAGVMRATVGRDAFEAKGKKVSVALVPRTCTTPRQQPD